MFTGLIEEIGKVSKIERSKDFYRLVVYAPKITEDIKKGDSICVDGICLTITDVEKEYFTVEVIQETLKRTTFIVLKKDQWVNLERALRATDRLGGHILTGHIDGVGEIVQKWDNKTFLLEIKPPQDLMKYIVPNGSIGVDGISLTVKEVEKSSFKVSIIPYTASSTTIGMKKVGGKVNIEVDIFAKYVERILGSREESVTVDFLKEKGFL